MNTTNEKGDMQVMSPEQKFLMATVMEANRLAEQDDCIYLVVEDHNGALHIKHYLAAFPMNWATIYNTGE